MTETGRVAFYHDRKQYGFIECDNLEEDIFFQHDFLVFEEGDRVSFDIEYGDKGPKAENIEIMTSPICSNCESSKVYHDRKGKYFCPFCTDNPGGIDDYAPTVYDKEGNPMKVRIVGAECMGDVSGDGGHWGYQPQSEEAELPTVWFEEIDD